ncbi:MAG: hypothetical protein J6C29_04865 [Clostridia bacterium]|nr:hypothetical protein [Clostridia bacterium]MBO5418097.1 hypothetical protein [Clostridia bacterium]
MEKDLLTVKEFADLAGVSVQSIYKKLGKANNPIQRYLKVVDGVKYIERRAYAILYSSAPAPTAAEEAPPAIVEEQTPPQPGESEAPPPKSSTDRILDILEQQLEEQRRQLQEKDKQIAAQTEQINSLLARLEESSQIINQQQQLTAMNVKALTGGESKEEPAAVDVEPQPQPEEKQTTPPPPPPEKKGFFSFFKRKG